MFIVAPSGSTKEVTSLDTPSSSSQVSVVIGRVPIEEAEEKATEKVICTLCKGQFKKDYATLRR
jgi:hypothetical protein